MEQALDAYDTHGRIERVPTRHDVWERIVDAWSTSAAAVGESIMLAARRDDVRGLNFSPGNVSVRPASPDRS